MARPRCRSLAGPVQPVWRRDAADLGRAGRGDRPRHQARRPQGQYRHRLPAGDDGSLPQGRDRRPGANSTRANSSSRRWTRCASSAGSGSSSSAPPATPQDQGDPACGDGEALSVRRARSAYRRWRVPPNDPAAVNRISRAHREEPP